MYHFKTKVLCILVWMKVTFAWKLEKRRSNTFRDLLLDRQNNLWEIVLLVLFLHAVETTSVKAFLSSRVVFHAKCTVSISFSFVWEVATPRLMMMRPPPFLYLIRKDQGWSNASHTPSAHFQRWTHKKFVVLKLQNVSQICRQVFFWIQGWRCVTGLKSLYI